MSRTSVPSYHRSSTQSFASETPPRLQAHRIYLLSRLLVLPIDHADLEALLSQFTQ